jgi:hypothetical protein
MRLGGVGSVCACWSASLNDPGPASLVLMTVYVVAFVLLRRNKDKNIYRFIAALYDLKNVLFFILHKEVLIKQGVSRILWRSVVL